jgi:hypothetical protein
MEPLLENICKGKGSEIHEGKLQLTAVAVYGRTVLAVSMKTKPIT